MVEQFGHSGNIRFLDFKRVIDHRVLATPFKVVRGPKICDFPQAKLGVVDLSEILNSPIFSPATR